MPAAELEPHLQSTVLLSSSIWPLRFWNSLVTPQRISKSKESHQDTCNSLSEEMKSWTPWSRLPLPAVVSSHTSTRPSLSSHKRAEPTTELAGSCDFIYTLLNLWDGCEWLIEKSCYKLWLWWTSLSVCCIYVKSSNANVLHSSWTWASSSSYVHTFWSLIVYKSTYGRFIDKKVTWNKEIHQYYRN